MVNWPQNLGGIAGAGLVSTFQDVQIVAAAGAAGPDAACGGLALVRAVRPLPRPRPATAGWWSIRTPSAAGSRP